MSEEKQPESEQVLLEALVEELALEGGDGVKEQRPESCVPPPPSPPPVKIAREYLSGDVLFRHIKRQANIIHEALMGETAVPTTVSELTRVYERHLFCPSTPPRKQENGTLPPNPRLNFYPTFIVPETLATYHLFFQNQKIPFSCKANRPTANEVLVLHREDSLPVFPAVEEVQKIFEGLGPEEVSKNALGNENSHLVELEKDSPRLAVLKRNISITHFAYPALNLPPKVMSEVIHNLVMKPVPGQTQLGGEIPDEQGGDVVSDEELIRWLGLKGKSEAEIKEAIDERRKMVMAAILVTSTLRSMERFFTTPDTIKKIGESLHYMFRQGYIRQACKISNVELTHLVTYMGILHENRIGHSTLHESLSGETRLDYVRDTIFLFLVYTWQTAMGVWQQCMEPENISELGKILTRDKKKLWCADSESLLAGALSEIVFPDNLLTVLQRGLPDIVNQSMMQQFRDFILERSAILPAMTTALPTDFVPIYYKQCPPQLWGYTYLMQLANYFMYHNDLQVDSSGEGTLLECYCRCNLCTPHRSLAVNTALLNEVNAIGTFELATPPKADGTEQPPLKLTPGMWTNAYLRKFESQDYYPYQIRYYEDQKKPTTKAELTACVITKPEILAQLQEIKKAREQFLLKKGRGVYLDPQTGEELNGELASKQLSLREKSEDHPDCDQHFQHGRRKSAHQTADFESAHSGVGRDGGDPSPRANYQQQLRGGSRRGGRGYGQRRGGHWRGGRHGGAGQVEESAYQERQTLGSGRIFH